ncbi:MAG: hypothetical protein KDK90_19535 [Leptospiraceae bacterium]|nr:hypothetical protein [Leptospiraceae bacterium]
MNFIYTLPKSEKEELELYRNGIKNIILISFFAKFPSLLSMDEIIQLMEKECNIKIKDTQTIKNIIEDLLDSKTILKEEQKYQVNYNQFEVLKNKYSEYEEQTSNSVVLTKTELHKLLSQKFKFKDDSSYDIFWEDFHSNFIKITSQKMLNLYLQLNKNKLEYEDYYAELQNYLNTFFSRYATYKTKIQNVIIEFTNNNEIFKFLLSKQFYEQFVLYKLALSREENYLFAQPSSKDVSLFIESTLMMLLQILNTLSNVEELFHSSIHNIASALIKDTYNKSLLYKNLNTLILDKNKHEILKEVSNVVSEEKNLYIKLENGLKELSESVSDKHSLYKDKFDSLKDLVNNHKNEFDIQFKNIYNQFPAIESSVTAKIEESTKEFKRLERTINTQLIRSNQPKISLLKSENAKLKKWNLWIKILLVTISLSVSFSIFYFLKDWHYLATSLVFFILAFIIYHTQNRQKFKFNLNMIDLLTEQISIIELVDEKEEDDDEITHLVEQGMGPTQNVE